MAVEEEANPSWVVELEQMLGNDAGGGGSTSRGDNEHYIHRVPQWIKEMTSSKAYTPSVVSLGPFHHGDPALEPMEAHKHRAVVSLVRRSGKPLRELAEAVEELAPQLEAAYERLGAEWTTGSRNRGRFMKVMLTDACFLLELVRAWLWEGEVDDKGNGDPVYSRLLDVLMPDVLLLENQLPMLLLRKILTILGPDSYFMVDKMEGEKMHSFHNYLKWEMDESEHHFGIHLLHYLIVWGNDFTPDIPVGAAFSASFFAFWRTSSSAPASSDCSGGDEDSSESMPTATELYEAGIHFEGVNLMNRFATAERLRDIVEVISFERGVLSIPVVLVHDYTEKMLLNLLAFERLQPLAGHAIMDFVCFMDCIIDTAADVARLRSSGVIVNLLGSDEEVANLFSKVLAKGAALSHDSKLRRVYRDVNAHCSKPWNKWRAMFMQTYMSNPWVFISLVAAVILLVATLVQTVYSAASFYQA